MNAKPLIIPSRLRKGACIGLFSPAGPVRDQQQVTAGINLLHDLGFRTRQYASPDHDHAYLAGSDTFRINEFHRMLADRDVDAMMAIRGGFGCLRIVDQLDYDLVRTSGKLLIGFSDITVLLNCISHQTGLVTIHGPVVSSLADSTGESVRAFTSLLTGDLPGYNEKRKIEVLRGGRAEGVLRGGNLTTLGHMIGTPFEVDWTGALLFLEDTGEPMYKIDRILTQLSHAGKLDGLAGLILGSFDLGDETIGDLRLQEQIWDRILELTRLFSYPIWGAFPAGHRRENYPLPVGMPAIMDSGPAELSFKTMLQ